MAWTRPRWQDHPGRKQAPNEAFVKTALRRQGIKIVEVSKARKEFKFSFGGSVSEKDVALFTRQLATMLKAGVPLIKAFDIVSDGASNPEVAKLLRQIKSDIETGMSLKQAFEKHPLKFDSLFCGLIGAAEAAGILDSLLERLAISASQRLMARYSSSRRTDRSRYQHRRRHGRCLLAW